MFSTLLGRIKEPSGDGPWLLQGRWSYPPDHESDNHQGSCAAQPFFLKGPRANRSGLYAGQLIIDPDAGVAGVIPEVAELKVTKVAEGPGPPSYKVQGFGCKKCSPPAGDLRLTLYSANPNPTPQKQITHTESSSAPG